MNAGKRAAWRKEIGDHGITKVSILSGIADQTYVASHCTYSTYNVIEERAALPREQGLVAAHAGAFSAHQDKPGAIHPDDDNIVKSCRR